MSQVPASTPSVRARMAVRILRAACPFLVIAMAVGIWQRERLWIWYCAERLERSSDEGRAAWAEKLTEVGEPAVPAMLRLLRSDDANVCAIAKLGLEKIASSWPKDDPRGATFAVNFVEAESRFSTPGRAAALDLLPLVVTSASPDIAEKARNMVSVAAKSESVDVRIQAVAAAMRPEVNCLHAVIPLLEDPSEEVRRAAVLALGPVREGGRPAIGDDVLLRCLHDADPEVRRLCEMGLRSRGRTPRDIRLGRRYTAPDPAERQKLLIDLADEEELDVTVWLERLTTDTDPAVRAGAARLAFARRADLRDRLQQMSESDPDGTVRRIADFYRRKMVAGR